MLCYINLNLERLQNLETVERNHGDTVDKTK